MNISVSRFIRSLIVPTSGTEDSRRQQYILSALLLGVSGLAATSFIRTLLDAARFGRSYHGISPIYTGLFTLLFLVLYFISRRRNYRISAYILVSIIAMISLMSLYMWSIDLPTGLLVLVLSIVMSGILISTSFSLKFAGGISSILLILAYLESHGISQPDKYWTKETTGIGDALTFIFIIVVITIVTWLTNREIEQSLQRARASEKALQEERDLLEARVLERTKQLEEAQRERIMQLYRFADFGRISSGLLHDIINPLTAVSLNLEQLNTKRRSELVRQAIEGIKYIEHFVSAARKQIQNPREISSFSPLAETNEIATTLSSKLRSNGVAINISIPESIRLFGSPIKYHQLLSNLLVNAVDAYDDKSLPIRKVDIKITEHPKQYILEVRDFGPGFSAEVIDGIFEPFFTTKPVEKGTGIGLFIAKRIVEEDFLGEITATNAKGGGASFTIRLPRHGD